MAYFNLQRKTKLSMDARKPDSILKQDPIEGRYRVIRYDSPDTVTTSEIQQASRHNETTQRLENTIDLGYIQYHLSMSIMTTSTFSKNSQLNTA